MRPLSPLSSARISDPVRVPDAPAAPGAAQGAATRADPTALRAPELPPARPAGAIAGLGAPVELLTRLLDRAERHLVDVIASPLPGAPRELAELYGVLGQAVASAEAALLSALDALDPRVGGGIAEPAAAYRALRKRAFGILRDAGVQFDRIEPAFGPLVHGPHAWAAQPVAVADDRGDGRPLYHYLNTYKSNIRGSSDAERRAAHDARVRRFVDEGGDFGAIVHARPRTFASLTAQLRYDYVIDAEGAMRLYPNSPADDGPGKPGHSLLASGGPEFDDRPVMLAGELWIYKDSAGDVEAVVVANNSGHFKPAFEDLSNATATLAALGVPKEKVIFFGGPNNLPSMMAEIAKNCGLGDLSHLLPPSPQAILAGLTAPPSNAVALRARATR